jgi:hypothetical protein
VDVFLTTASLKALRAIVALSPGGRKGGKTGGFLLGHVRGGQYFVEGALAAPAGGWAEHETYDRLDTVEPGRFIGFFVFSRSASERRKIGAPHACGKVILAVAPKKNGSLEFRGFRIDYTGRFVFEPLPVVEEKETAP